jgi:hypothetical protein
MNLFERLRHAFARIDQGYGEVMPLDRFFTAEEHFKPRNLSTPSFWFRLIRLHGRIERWWHDLGLWLVEYAYARPRLSSSYSYVLKPAKALNENEEDDSR